jgi:hypothetical protein
VLGVTGVAFLCREPVFARYTCIFSVTDGPINATELNLVNKSVPIQENLTTKNLSGKEKKYF